MSDADLDASYASSYASMKGSSGAVKLKWANVVAGQANEILTRIGGFTGFVRGAFGGTRFPQYDAIQRAGGGGFVQAAQAQTSLSESAANVAVNVGTALKWGGAIGLGLAAVVLFALIKRK